MRDPIIELALGELVQKHGCHTVILYGSRALGDSTDESDYDVAGFREEQGRRLADARIIDGKFLDAFVYCDQEVLNQPRDFLQLRGGVVLYEKGSFGRELLAELDRIFAEGPEPKHADELQLIRVWIQKMLRRISRGDLEGHYRRAWLQFDLLESYFALRGQWYLGSKRAFQWLAANDPQAFALFDRALAPDASLSELEQLATRVLSSE